MSHGFTSGCHILMTPQKLIQLFNYFHKYDTRLHPNQNKFLGLTSANNFAALATSLLSYLESILSSSSHQEVVISKSDI